MIGSQKSHTVFIAVMALMPVLAFAAPRALSFGPGLAALVYLAHSCFFLKIKPAWPRTALIIVAAILALALLSALWSIAPDVSLERTGKLALLMLAGALLLGAAEQLDLGSARSCLWLIPAGLLLGTLLIAVDVHTGNTLYRLFQGLEKEESVRWATYNRAAIACVLCAFPALALLRQSVKTPPAIAYGVFAAVFAVMLLSVQSQSAQFGILLGLLFMVAFPYRCRASWIALIAVIAALMLAAPFISIWAFNHLAPAIDRLPFLGRGDGYGGARLEIWDYVSRYALERPLPGYGIEATRTIEDFDSAQIYQRGTSILHPHNFALQLWMEFGLPGVITGAALIGYMLWQMHGKLSAEQARIALPTFICMLSIASTSYGMWQSWLVGLVFLSVFYCLTAIRNQTQQVRDSVVPANKDEA